MSGTCWEFPRDACDFTTTINTVAALVRSDSGTGHGVTGSSRLYINMQWSHSECGLDTLARNMLAGWQAVENIRFCQVVLWESIAYPHQWAWSLPSETLLDLCSITCGQRGVLERINLSRLSAHFLDRCQHYCPLDIQQIVICLDLHTLPVLILLHSVSPHW